MRGRQLLFGILFLMLIGIGSAATTVNVKTLPHHTVFVTPIKVGGGFISLASPVEVFSGEYGDLKVIFNDEELSDPEFDLNILVKENDTSIHSERILGGFSVGEETELIISLPEGVEPIYDNSTVVEGDAGGENPLEDNVSEGELGQETEVSNDSLEEKKGLFSSSYGVVERNKSVFYSIYYLLMMFVLLSILFFMFKKHITKFSKNVGINIKKDDEKDEGNKDKSSLGKEKKKSKKGRGFSFFKKKERDIDSLADVDELAVAEKELKEAQEKVEKLRAEKKESLAEAKKKLIDAEKEIMKLRGVKVDKDDKEISSEDLKKRLKDNS